MTETVHPGRQAASRAVPPRLLTTENVVADNAGFNRGPARLAPTLLRSRAVSGRRILAHVVSQGRLTPSDLESIGEREDREELIKLVDPRAAGAYARVLAHPPGSDLEERAAIDLFGALVDAYGPGSLAQGDLNLYAQLVGKHRRRGELQELLGVGEPARESGLTPDVEAALRADLCNPFLYGGQDEGRFLELFNSAIDPGTVAPVRLRAEGVTPFDRLAAADLGRSSGPLITVVTSCYNPDHALIGAARSLIAQSWVNWEMLIVDDASTDAASVEILGLAERLDPRIRVIRKAINGGTYRARNTALMQARGAFMTFLDSDDWAHPQRLAEGVRPMLENLGIMATRSGGTRVTEHLELTRPGYRTHFSTAASLMIRVPEVPARIGFFDTARKSADTEFSRRIESAFGRKIHDIKGRALTIVRRAEGTLSAADFSYGWQHQSRWAYKQAYRFTHRSITEGSAPYRAPHGPSPHYGAHRWAKPGDPEYRRDRRFDVVLAGDWRRFGGPQVSMLEEIAALREGGLRVGVMHLEAMRFRTEKDQPLCGPLRVLLRDGQVELVFPDDDVEIDLLILRYPPVLQFLPVVKDAVRPRKLFIMANQAPCEPDGSDQRYVPLDVHRNATELFGAVPRWVSQSRVIRRILEPLLPTGVLTDWDNPGIIDPLEWHTSRPRPSQKGLVVGRFSRDDKIKFPPSGKDFVAAYALPAPVEVKFLGAAGQVRRLLGEIGAEKPANWTVLPHGAVDARQFVKELDVVVYMDHPDAHEAFGRVLLESAASGALVIAAPKHEVNFGDALVYSDPEGVPALLKRYLDDPELFRSQVELSLRRVRERWSYESYRERIEGELTKTAADEVPPASTAPHGVVTIRRERPGRMVVESDSDTLAGIVVPVRRFADAELADHLVVVHHPDDAERASHFADEVRATHDPGTVPRTFDKPLPPGIHALVHHADGEWAVRLAAGGRAETADASCWVNFTH